MAKPLLRGREHARKRALAANISPNQTDVKQEQAEELGPLHILLRNIHGVAVEIRYVPTAVFGCLPLTTGGAA